MMPGISLRHVAILWLLLAFLASASALAHKPSDSYLRITAGEGPLTAEWDIALKDLDFVVGLDANQNGQITWGELKAQRDAVAAHALSRLRIVADGTPCNIRVVNLLVNRHSDGTYAVLALEIDGPSNPDVLQIEYSLLFDVDPTHRGLVLYTNGSAVSTHVLSPDDPTVELRTGETSLWQAFADYVYEGVWHILIGFDHILFLLSLLIPAVMVRSERRWEPVDAFKPAWKTVLKIVTVFTLAHSITLWLAVMEYVTLPGRFVEATIAFSIIVTALNNLYPALPLSGWAIAFIFGLVHGFGFANVLVDLGLSGAPLTVALLSFNVGVELGQLAIVLVFFPLAFKLRASRFYRHGVLQIGSILIAIVAGLWMYERLFNAEIIGF